MPAKENPNVLYYGDNLDILRRYVDNESVDLVYLDPPFNSKATYNMLFAEQDGSQAAAQIKAFEDTWSWAEAAPLYAELELDLGRVGSVLRPLGELLPHGGLLAYLVMMAPRLAELHRVLKPTGSLYLHCDPTASHYLKLLLDAIFGPERFLCEIIWKRTTAQNSANRPGPVHDVIFMVTRSESYLWNQIYLPHDSSYLASHYTQKDSDGRRWMPDNLTGAGTSNGETGLPWRGFNVTAKGRHWRVQPVKLDRWDAAGLIYWPEKAGSWPRFKKYLDKSDGVPLQDVWTDIDPLNSQAKERLGYPTQKPSALLERIILASSNEGDVVLDPFCGCGTTIAVAERLKRRWIGIDITHLAIGLLKHRLQDAFGEKVAERYEVIGEPTSQPDAATLAAEDPFQFQAWALGLVGARVASSANKGADKGIDGRLYFHDEPGGKTKQVILSVKAGHTSVPHLRDLRGVLDREKAEIGVLITMQEPTKPMKVEAAGAGFYDSPFSGRHPRLQVLTVAELLAGKCIDMPPIRQVSRTFKKAPRAKAKPGQQEKLFGDK